MERRLNPTHGRRLWRALTAAGRRKHLVVWKVGRTRSGARAANSHTGSLAGETRIWSGMLRQAGALKVRDLDELLDILVLFRIFVHFKWVSKIENFRVPLIGWNMSLNRYIKLKRGDRASVLRMLQACQKTLAEGSSIMMFPEGTRSPDGSLRAFNPGAFELALNSQRPILPIAIQGTSEALPKRGFVLQGRHPIRVTVLDELPYRSFANESVPSLSNRVRGLIADQLQE